ncbi:MAG: TatD family hydrolase [Desulfomonilaceae bacterium]
MNEELSKPFPLIDSHAHLELEPLVNDTHNVIARARKAGLVAIITVGIDIEDSRKAIEISHEFDDVFVSIGFHPHNAQFAADKDLQTIESMAADPKVVGYGEIGLDFFRNRSPRNVQIRIFDEQIRIAQKLNKPVVIHLRDAYDEGLMMLEKAAPFPNSGVIHCFSGNQEDAKRALRLGFYISIPGTVTYKKNDQLRSIVSKIPEDRILLETDCPFLSPEPFRGKDNEPSFIVNTARKVSEARGISLEQACQITTKNAIDLFKLPPSVLRGAQRS